MSPQFLQLVTRVPTTFVYGLGENSRSSFRRSFEYETVAMFSRDQPPGDVSSHLLYLLILCSVIILHMTLIFLSEPTALYCSFSLRSICSVHLSSSSQFVY